MGEHLSKFIDAMTNAGCAPARVGEVVETAGKWRDIDGAEDRKGSKKVYYRFKTDDMGAVGQYGHRREGVAHTWHSKSARTWSDAEKAAWKARTDQARKAQLAEQQAAYNTAAAEAAKLWARSTEPGAHAYLARKGIKAQGIRQDGGDLLLPLRGHDGKLWSVQRISEDGDKLFMRGGRTDGVYMTLGTPGPVWCVAEGYATAWSIMAATGLPVAVAYCARNLLAVTKWTRELYPDARIIVCADNDIREGGGNVGVEKGQRAAAAVSGYCVYPAERGDFNDVMLASGLEAVKAAVLAVPVATAPERSPLDLHDAHGIGVPVGEDERPAAPIEAYEADARERLAALYQAPILINKEWAKFLVKNDKGNLSAKNIINLDLILRNHADYAGLFIYDEFSNVKTVSRCPPWESEQEFEPHTLTDEDVTALAIDLAKKKLEPGYENIRRVLDAIVKTAGKHPAREYFNGLVWDGEPRLATWLRDYCGARVENSCYLAAVGTKWLTASVTRVFRPGCKFDHILVLEGPQNAGKSLMLKELATIHERAYFTDTVKIRDIEKPDSIRKMQGRLIIELAELSGIHNKDVNELKQIITVTEDVIRRLYKDDPSTLPRQFIFAGTTNNKKYLHDSTGNRRFWPVTVGAKINIDAIKRDREQLWAEAVDRYRAGEELYLDEELYKKAEAVQAERREEDPWHDDVEKLTRNQDFIKTSDVWDVLVPSRAMRTTYMQSRLGSIMENLGFEKGRQQSTGDRARGWVRKGTGGTNQEIPLWADNSRE